MFNSLKIKLHVATRMFQKKPKPGFVNPYAPAIPEPTSRINPYITDYGSKKKKSIEELITERVGIVKHDNGANERRIPSVVVTHISQEPTFFHDMKEMFIGDLLFVANKFPKRVVKERVVTAEQIARACEEPIRW